MTMKEIREQAEAVEAVSNAATLRVALPIVIAGQERMKSILSTLATLRAAISALSEKCANYALDHVNCFDVGLSVSPVGVQSGDITVDGKIYHLAAGYDGIKRIGDETLTQEFLGKLPKDWTTAYLKLDTTGINRLGVTVDQLEEKGLYRPAKNVWSDATPVPTSE